MVIEPSVFEPLKFYCTLKYYVIGKALSDKLSYMHTSLVFTYMKTFLRWQIFRRCKYEKSWTAKVTRNLDFWTEA